MLILAELDFKCNNIISYEVVDDIPFKYKSSVYFSYGFAIDSDRYRDVLLPYYYFNIENALSFGADNLTSDLLKILRKEKLKNIG